MTARFEQPRYAALRLAREVRLLAKAATPAGWGRKDFVGSSANSTFAKDAKRLVLEGRLFAASITGGHRYFATVELRDAFVADKTKHRPVGRPAGAGTRNCADFGVDDKATIPAGVQVQYAPRPRGRFEVDGPVIGGFVTEWRTLRGASA